MSHAQLSRGANAALSGATVTLTCRWSPDRPGGPEMDAALYICGAGGKVRGDADMVFFNQPTGAGGAVRLDTADRTATAILDLAAIPPDVEKVALTLTTDGAPFSTVGPLSTSLQDGPTVLLMPVDTTGMTETSLIVTEVYRRNGAWKVRSVAQGFAGGLKPLAESFGVEVEDETLPAPLSGTPGIPKVAAPTKVDIAKKLVSLEKQAPALVSLVKAAHVSLEKRNVANTTAKVALCLDISGSMLPLFRSGAVQQLVDRIMALGFTFDDDGEIDVFCFDDRTINHGPVTLAGYRTLAADLKARYDLGGGTRYGAVMQEIRRHYSGQPDFGKVPVYVMFVTDGGTEDKAMSRKMLVEASREGIFWQFMAIAPGDRGLFGRRGSRTVPRGFDFLGELDTMTGRVVDNANFFTVSDPASLDDAEFFDLLMAEYPQWLQEALAKGVVAR